MPATNLWLADPDCPTDNDCGACLDNQILQVTCNPDNIINPGTGAPIVADHAAGLVYPIPGFLRIEYANTITRPPKKRFYSPRNTSAENRIFRQVCGNRKDIIANFTVIFCDDYPMELWFGEGSIAWFRHCFDETQAKGYWFKGRVSHEANLIFDNNDENDLEETVAIELLTPKNMFGFAAAPQITLPDDTVVTVNPDCCPP